MTWPFNVILAATICMTTTPPAVFLAEGRKLVGLAASGPEESADSSQPPSRPEAPTRPQPPSRPEATTELSENPLSGAGGGGGAAERTWRWPSDMALADMAMAIQAIQDMDEEEAVEVCEEEGIDWEKMEGLTELRQALTQHFTNRTGGVAGHGGQTVGDEV